MRLQEFEKLEKHLKKMHGVEDYETRFDNSKTRFGCVRYASKYFSYSKPMIELNNREMCIGIILHEIAHIFTKGEHHNKVFKAKAKEIGGFASTYYPKEVITPPKGHSLTCPNCGKVSFRHRARYDLACGKCCKEFNKGKYTREYLLKCEKVI